MEIQKIIAEIKEKSDKKGGIRNVYFIACGGSLAGIYAGWYQRSWCYQLRLRCD